MRQLVITGLLLVSLCAQSSAQSLAFQTDWAATVSMPAVSSSVTIYQVRQEEQSSVGYKSPFGIKWLSGVGGLTVGLLVGGTLQIIQQNVVTGALVLLLTTAGCAGGITLAGNSYGDEGSFWLSWLGCAGGTVLTFFLAELSRGLTIRNNDVVVFVSGVAAVLGIFIITLLAGTFGYDLSRRAPKAGESGSLLHIKDGQLCISPVPSVSASYQHPTTLYSVRLLQVQF